MKKTQKHFVFIFSLLIFISNKAYSLDCTPPKLNKSIITNSIAIFEGTAERKRNLTSKQKAAVKDNNLSDSSVDIANLSVFDFIVKKRWKGVSAGQTVSILSNTYWGDNYAQGGNYLIVSHQRVGDMFWTPLCGNSIDLQLARQNNDLKLLEGTLGPYFKN